MNLTEQEVQNIFTYLGDVPSKYANPLISLFQQKIEQEKNVKKEDESTKDEEK